MSGRGDALGYRPALDGMRAVAVILVLLYHGGVSWAAGGFLGVDVFFVLSGFLITSLLMQEWRRTGRIALRAFWLRRARRLFPAMLVVLVATAGYFLVGRGLTHLRGDFLSTLFYVSNWWFTSTDQSYFAQFLEPSPLRHTWSLAIEEQFYILFPLLLVLLLGRLRLGVATLRGLLALGAVGSAMLMAALHDPGVDPSRVYYGTDTRAQALLVGAVLAVSPSWRRPTGALYARVGGRLLRLPGSRFLGWVALAGLLVVIAVAREVSPWMYRGGFLLTALLAAGVIASVWSDPASRLGRLLAWRPLVAVGVVSYGLYLWHWPVYVALDEERTGLHGPGLLAVRLVVTGLLAVASHHLVEEPIRTRRLQRRFTRTQWRRLVSVSLVSVIGGLVWATAGAPASSGLASSADRAAPVPDSHGRLVKTFLLGDSQAYALRDHFGNRVDGLAVSGSTQLGCFTLLPERVVDGEVQPKPAACSQWEDRWVKEVTTQNPDIVLLMLGQGELFDRKVGESVLTFGTPAYRDWLDSEIDRRRELVAGNARHFAIATVLCMGIDPDAAGRTADIVNDADRLAWLNDAVADYARTHTGVELVDLHDTICRNGYVATIDGVTLRDDGLHLNEAGAQMVWARIAPRLFEISG